MLNTYIKNRGYTKTIIHDHNKNKVNELNWDADYDGDNANIMLTSTTDGKKKIVGIQLDNNDLANLLNISSVDMPLHRRLHQDFIKEEPEPIPKLVKIELPYTDTDMKTPELLHIQPYPRSSSTSIEELITPDNFLSSPAPNDKLIIPVTINERPSHNYTLTHRRHHIRPKTHKTYRVYKVHKKPKHSSRKASKSSKKSTPKSISSKSSRKSSKFSIF
jgi:hypothetical protein